MSTPVGPGTGPKLLLSGEAALTAVATLILQ
jgi:hypothetical protein